MVSAGITNAGSPNWQGEYVYHKNGDMTSRTINSGTPASFAYQGNEMSSASGSENFTLGYDLNGNLTTGRKDANTPVSLTYNWDNKLRSASVEGNSISVKYDPAGNRISKNSAANGNKKYIADTVSNVPKVILELDATNNNILKSYVHTDKEVLKLEESGSSHRYYYLHDRLGSVRQIIDETGAVKNLYTYDPWGRDIERQETISNPYKFAGYFWDDELGMYYCINRYYHPELMRWISSDSILGNFYDPLSLHKYLYCENDPINNYDLNGRWTEDIHREFGDYGHYNFSNPSAPVFDYARLDRDKSAWDSRYRKLHFESREEILPNLLGAIAFGSVRGFEYTMHQWQDSYVHRDQGYKDGHLDTRVDIKKGNERRYERCDATTRQLESVWMKYNEGAYKGLGVFNKLSLLIRDSLHRNDDLWMTDDNGNRQDITDY